MAPPVALPTADACLAAARAVLDQALQAIPSHFVLGAAALLVAVVYLIVDALRYAAIPTIQVPLTEGEPFLAAAIHGLFFWRLMMGWCGLVRRDEHAPTLPRLSRPFIIASAPF